MDFDALNRLLAQSGCFSGSTVAGWTTDLAVVVPLLLGLGLYATGVVRLWRKAGVGRGANPLQVSCFFAGWLLMAAALVSPLHQLSMELFWVHMVEHEVVMAAAAPLLVLARPLGPMLWAFPVRWRRSVAVLSQTVAFVSGWDILSRPLVATIAHAVAIWLWHIPFLYEAALLYEPIHWLQHLSFLVTALFFWWAMLEGRRDGAAVADLFLTAMHTGFLGVLLTVSPRAMYPLQSVLSSHWGIDPLTDQQLAGLIMWVPAGTVYLGAGLWMAWRWISHSGQAASWMSWRGDHVRDAG